MAELRSFEVFVKGKRDESYLAFGYSHAWAKAHCKKLFDGAKYQDLRAIRSRRVFDQAAKALGKEVVILRDALLPHWCPPFYANHEAAQPKPHAEALNRIPLNVQAPSPAANASAPPIKAPKPVVMVPKLDVKKEGIFKKIIKRLFGVSA